MHRKILSTLALSSLITTSALGAVYDTSNIEPKSVGARFLESDFNAIVDTITGISRDDAGTTDGSDDTLNFTGKICDGAGNCLDSVGAAGGKFVDGTTATDAVFQGGNVGIGTDSPEDELQIIGSLMTGKTTDDFHSVLNANNVIFKRDNNYSYIRQNGIGGHLSFVTSNTTAGDTHAMTIKSSGNVGIGTGTTALTEKLEVDGNVKATAFIGDGSQLTGIAAGGGKFVDGTTAADAVFTGGNVGIGTDSPSSALDINGSITVRSAASLSRDIDTSALIISGGNAVNTGANVELYGSTHSSFSNQAFYDASAHNFRATNLTPMFKIDGENQKSYFSNGDVGIGTPDPDEKLEVDGNVKATAFIGDGSQLTGIASGGGKFVDGTTATDAVFQGGNVGIGTDAPGSKLDVAGRINTEDEIVFQNSTKGKITWHGTNDFNVRAGENMKLFLGVDSKEDAIAIDINSHVGIGTTSPTEKLDVDGKIRIRSNSLGTCDATNEGAIGYASDATRGTFYGCAKIGATSYDWLNLQMFGQ